ncbi:MAG TPA: phytoene/squalene synthase family protein [Chloroflexia bacterium]|nr:phytoene/squalene synthase family protein [Chloroflexia bacterium]
MERNASMRYGALSRHFLASHVNPPASKQVLDRLAESLTLPSVNGAADKLIGRGQSPAKSGPGREMLWAYRTCTEIIRKHSRSFYFSARLLPHAKRHGIMALYAFCRTSDDLVDAADGMPNRESARDNARAALDRWAVLAGNCCASDSHPVAAAWADTRLRFGIPSHLAEELLSGIRMDLTIDRYETWDDLWVYCYRVASTVGLMSMYVTGAERMEAVPYAVQLGVALQLTNILRDIGEDARAGRVYIPAEDMKRFGYTDEMLFAGVNNRNFRRLVEFQIERAHALYDAAMPGIALLPRDSRMAVTAAATVYRGILDKIRGAGYDVFTRRAHVSMGEKLCALPGIWWATRWG